MVAHEEDAWDVVAWIRILFVSPYNKFIPYSFFLTMGCSNNTTEYEPVIVGIELALQIPDTNLTIYSDSHLIVRQLLQEYRMKKMELIPDHKRAEQLLIQF